MNVHASLWATFASPQGCEPLQQRTDGLYAGRIKLAHTVDDIPEFIVDDTQDHFGLQWNRFAAVQFDSVNGTTESRDRLLNQSGLVPADFEGKTVLEVGCGAGRFTEVLLAMGARVVSTDFSTAVRANRRAHLAAETEERVVFARASVFELPFRPRSFDIVLCCGVLQHTGNPQLGLEKLWEMVAEEGLLVVDRYRLAAQNLMPFKYLLRPLTKRMDSLRLLGLVERYVRTIFPRQVDVLRRLQGRGLEKVLRRAASRLTLNSVFPGNLHVQGRLDWDTALTWSILDTFDMYGPRYDSPQTHTAWRRGLRRLKGGSVERCIVCGQGNAATVRRHA